MQNYKDSIFYVPKKVMNKGYEICDIKSVVKYSSYDELYDLISHPDMEFTQEEINELVSAVLSYDRERENKISLLFSISTIESHESDWNWGYDDYEYDDDRYHDLFEGMED